MTRQGKILYDNYPTTAQHTTSPCAFGNLYLNVARCLKNETTFPWCHSARSPAKKSLFHSEQLQRRTHEQIPVRFRRVILRQGKVWGIILSNPPASMDCLVYYQFGLTVPSRESKLSASYPWVKVRRARIVAGTAAFVQRTLYLEWIGSPFQTT